MAQLDVWLPARMSVLSHLFGGREASAAKLTSVTEIAAHIQQLLSRVHSGTLQYWGVWFGRPYDNQHSIVRTEADDDCLTFHFNEEETLRVWHPSGVQIDSQQFIIWSASRVIWQWYWSGRPHTPGNLMSEELIRDGASISFQSTFPGQHSQTPNIHEPAVQIH